MRDGVFGHHDKQYKYMRDSANMGFNEETKEWQWNEVFRDFKDTGFTFLRII